MNQRTTIATHTAQMSHLFLERRVGQPELGVCPAQDPESRAALLQPLHAHRHDVADGVRDVGEVQHLQVRTVLLRGDRRGGESAGEVKLMYNSGASIHARRWNGTSWKASESVFNSLFVKNKNSGQVYNY